MGNIPPKKVLNADAGDADHVGGNDWDDVVDFLNDVDKTGPVIINTDFRFRDDKLKFRDSGNNHNYTHSFADLSADRIVNWPLLPTDDTVTFNDMTATLKNKTIDLALNPVKLRADYKYTIFIDENDSNKYKCRDNDSGSIVSSDASNASVPIQFAIDGANGKAILIRQGNYLCGTFINAKDTYGAIYGEGNRDEDQTTIGSTVLTKNYSAAAGDIFFDADGSDFFYFELHDIVFVGDNEGIGVAYGHNLRQLNNVGIFKFRSGLELDGTVYADIYNIVIEDCVDYGCKLFSPNTTYFYGGRIKSCDIDLLIQDGNDAGFFGTVLEHGTTHCVFLDSDASGIQPNDIFFYGCSFESASGSLTSLVKNEGLGVSFYNCRFDATATDYTIIHCTDNAEDTLLQANYFQANTASTTARITIDSGAKRNTFLFNKKHQGGQITSLVFTDNGTDTTCLGNESISNKIPFSLSFNGTTFFNANATLGAGLITQGFVRHEGDISPTQLSADQHDYNPTGLSTASRIRLSGDSSFRTITGIQGGVDGRLLKLSNVSTGSILLRDQSTLSGTAANRFDFGGYDIPLLPSNSLELIYDSTDSRWRTTSSQLTIMPATGYGYYFHNDMFGVGSDVYWSSTTSSGGTVTAVNAAAGHQGIVNYTSGTSGTGSAGMRSTNNANVILLGNSWYHRFDCIVRLSVLSDGTNTYILRAGYQDQITAEPVDGVYFRYNKDVNSGKWVLVARSNNAETTFNATNTAVAASTWYHLTIIINPAGTVADFYQDGTFLGQVTSNIPTGGSRNTSVAVSFLKSAGTADIAFLDIDSVTALAYANVTR